MAKAKGKGGAEKKPRAIKKTAAKKTPAKKTTTKKPAAKKASKPAAAPSAGRTSWLDKTGSHPLIEQYARQLDTFMQTMADGRVDAAEIEAQEGRLVKLMKEVEPKLDDALHEQVTHLLCELTAYDLMQTLFNLQQASAQRPRLNL
jgi:hypothetical protein